MLILAAGCVSVLALAACTTPGIATPTGESVSPGASTPTSAPAKPTATTAGGGATASPTAKAASSTPVPAPTSPARVGSGLSPTPVIGDSTWASVDTVVTDVRQIEGGLLVAADGTELAVLLPASQSSNSVCGEGGAPFGETSIFNDVSPYGGPFGASSPFNPDTVSPPMIVVDGQFIGHLSVSPFVTSPVDPYSVLELLGCPLLRG